MCKIYIFITIDSHSVVTQQPSLSKVQHSPGPLTGDMYTVPKKFEIKSSSSFHDYDTVADGFDGTLLLYQIVCFNSDCSFRSINNVLSVEMA